MSKDVYGDFAAGFVDLYHRVFTVELTGGQLLVLISQVQLALRHNNGPGAEVAREVIDGLLGLLGEADPRIMETMLRGFDPDYDDVEARINRKRSE